LKRNCEAKRVAIVLDALWYVADDEYRRSTYHHRVFRSHRTLRKCQPSIIRYMISFVGDWARTDEISRSSICRLLGLERKWLTCGQIDASDPVLTRSYLSLARNQCYDLAFGRMLYGIEEGLFPTNREVDVHRGH
jgi:hypothetical protein